VIEMKPFDWLRSWQAPLVWLAIGVLGVLAGKYSVALYFVMFVVFDLLLVLIPLAWIVKALEFLGKRLRAKPAAQASRKARA
jgi:hypothetical protein